MLNFFLKEVTEAAVASAPRWVRIRIMRIPFDLFAALMAIWVVGNLPELSRGADGVHAVCAAGVWAAFWLVTWILNEYVTRRTEWRIRFGRRLNPESSRRHPLEIHGHAIVAVQIVSIALYALGLYALQWPQFVKNWPVWLGLQANAKIWGLPLKDSSAAEMLLNFFPYLIAVLLSWLPRPAVAVRNAAAADSAPQIPGFRNSAELVSAGGVAGDRALRGRIQSAAA